MKPSSGQLDRQVHSATLVLLQLQLLLQLLLLLEDDLGSLLPNIQWRRPVIP
jgi:hypothetical protein